jgi:hypothetical protein
MGAILTSYDSSADYWKFLNNGNLLFDGKHNLYDEYGNLLREATESKSYTKSLAEVLGISEDEAGRMLSEYKWENGGFVFEDGKKKTSIWNNVRYQIHTPDDVKINYFFQRDFVDNVFGKYEGDMVRALTNAKADLASRGYQMSSDIYANYMMFAAEWNTVVFGTGSNNGYYYRGLWDQNLTQRYYANNHEELFNKIYQDIPKGNKDETLPTDAAAMYEFINSFIFPVLGKNVSITTRAVYDENDPGLIKYGLAGKPHSSSGLAIDLGTKGYSRPIVTTQFETIYTNTDPVHWTTSGFGYYLKTYGLNTQQIYGHMADNSYASNRVNTLAAYARMVGVNRLLLPPGFQIGDVGSTGMSTGPHLHYQLNISNKITKEYWQ